MKCDLYRPLLSTYVDGEATPAEAVQVEAHLGACPQCSRILSEYRLLRAQVTDLPRYRPDPRVRRRLLASLDAIDAGRTEEVTISRRWGIAPAGRPAPLAGGLRLFGGLANVFALLLIIAAGVLVWQMSGNVLPPQVPTPAGAVIAVPTSMPVITQAEMPGPQVTSTAGHLVAPVAGGHAASPTATLWSPTESDAAVQAVRDGSYGYTLEYPGGWWTASAGPVAGLLAHRVLRPWAQRDGQAPAADMSIDVLDNGAGLPPQEVMARAGEAASAITPLGTAIANLAGFSSVTMRAGRQRRATYLFAGPLVYRIVAETVPGAAAGSDTPSTNVSDNLPDFVLRSFHPAPAAALPSRSGYAPLLFLHDGDLWQVEQDGAAPRPLTTDHLVRGFALAPDLSRVAVLLAAEASGALASRLEMWPLPGGKRVTVWPNAKIRAVAWYGDHDLVAIGAEAVPASTHGPSPLGLYRLNLLDAMGIPPRLLVSLANLPQGGAGAVDLQVSPDRLWISFIAAGLHGPDLYGVRPDGTYLRSLLPNTASRPTVDQHAWLPPVGGDAPNRLVLRTGQALYRLTLPGAGEPESRLDPLSVQGQSDLSDLAVAPSGQVAVMVHGRAAPTLLVTATNGAAGASLMPLPADTAVADSLQWSANGRYVLYEQTTPAGNQVQMVTVPEGTVAPLAPPWPHR